MLAQVPAASDPPEPPFVRLLRCLVLRHQTRARLRRARRRLARTTSREVRTLIELEVVLLRLRLADLRLRIRLLEVASDIQAARSAAEDLAA